MDVYLLTFTLLTDATFGRGDGMAGVVDAEVQHDQSGLPYLGGRALKGLLNDACADILFAVRLQNKHHRWEAAAAHLFGGPGSRAPASGCVEFGDALLPGELRTAVRSGVEREELRREQVLGSLTAVRRETAVDPRTGTPKRETLRSLRLILRQTRFEAELRFSSAPSEDDLALLAACVKAFRRAGTGRNRGRGELQARLLDVRRKDITDELFERFHQGVAA